jgi:SAM-dependent methyltransferase
MLERIVSRLPAPVRHRVQRWRHPASADALGSVRPVSEWWGFDRGTPVDRYYIAQFVHEHAADIAGRVLEVRNSEYTRRFGRDVVRADVLDIDATNPDATVVADLSAAGDVAAEQFDCFILTQTLQFIYDVRSAVAHAQRFLRPGGVLLATVPAVSRIAPRDGIDTDQWRFTPASCTRMFGDAFGADRVEVRSYGNVFAASAFLRGLAVQELPRRKLDVHDPYFPLIVAVRAVKREGR